MRLLHGDSLDLLKTLPDNSVDSVVTDPPYHLTSITKRFGKPGSAPAQYGTDGAFARASRGFMGKEWDGGDIAFRPELWAEVMRVLKPGGHLLAFSSARTYHRMAVAIEDAGFEVRDQIMWLYGTGFPKSLNVSKAIDKMAGAEREVVGRNPNSRENCDKTNSLYEPGTVGKTAMITAPATDAAKQWEGWGTALKPSHEPICVARKPLEGTVAENVLRHGTGALNIDACRIGETVETWLTSRSYAPGSYAPGQGHVGETQSTGSAPAGRWPANLIHDGSPEVEAEFAKYGERSAGHWAKTKTTGFGEFGGGQSEYHGAGPKGDKGSASRFFYCAKASKKDRDAGLDGFPVKQATGGGGGIGDYLNDVNSASGKFGSEKAPARNVHPTVKPTELMKYICRLITPPGGVVLDPFMGSGSTGKACALEGFDFIGIEREAEYLAIAQARIDHALAAKEAQ